MSKTRYIDGRRPVSRRCEHRPVVVGSDETGCRSIYCSSCNVPLRRVRDGDEYIYVERPPPADGRG